MNKELLTKAKNKQIVCVDFFDTLMFRAVHSHQLMPEWEKSLKRKYPSLEIYDLCQFRKEAITTLGGDECAIPYCDLLLEICNKLDGKVIFKDFFNISYLIDYSMDMITQYPNMEIVDTLKFLKNQGKRIYLVSDYYLPGVCFESYLRPYGLIDLFDGVYCSSDYKKTKFSGELYETVINELGVCANDVLMIGDSKISDYRNARSLGITSIRYFPIAHKLLTNIRKRFGFDYKKCVGKNFYSIAFNNTLFCDYALNLYYFTKELYREISLTDERNIGFLARGGYFLKQCFERYVKLIPDNESIAAYYIKNSRKVNNLALNSQEDKELLADYISNFAVDKAMTVVDEGWYCTSQITIEKLTGIKVKGYYLGVMGREKEDSQYKRKGLLFDIDEDGNKSPYYGVFRTNCTFYEQLLSAPHGSTVKYCRMQDCVSVEERWQDIEKNNYYENIEPLQIAILDYLTGLKAWDCKIEIYELSQYVMHTLMFGSMNRIRAMKIITDAWYDNANDTNEKKFASIKKVRVYLPELLISPENYLRYFCRLKDLKLEHPWMRAIYPVLGPCIYLYCKFSIFIKRNLDTFQR